MDAVLIHVLDALIDVEATGAHLVEAHRLEADLLLGLAGDGVQADGGVPAAVDLPHLLGAGVDVAERVDGLARDLDDPRAPVTPNLPACLEDMARCSRRGRRRTIGRRQAAAYLESTG